MSDKIKITVTVSKKKRDQLIENAKKLEEFEGDTIQKIYRKSLDIASKELERRANSPKKPSSDQAHKEGVV